MSCIRREEPESYRRSQPRRPRAWILKWQHLFCIRPECEEDTEFNSFPETKRLQIEGTEGEKDHGKGSRKSSIKGEDIVMGLDDELTKIVDELTRPPAKLVMVTIAGMSGIGKTTLARKVYGNKRVLHHFDYAAWVCGKSILDQAFSQILNSIQMASDKSQERVTEETHGKSIGDKGQSLWRILRKKRYLIVVDDFWDSNWNAIERYFPDDQVGSRILVTSRSKKFCTNVPQNSPHCLRLLNADQSWKMLEILVFGKESCPSELVDVGEAIATTCGGLRLTIAVIAGILHNIPRSSISWKNLRGYIRSDAYVNSVSCLDILSLSYKYLPYHLKACFLFMGSFPANCEIDAKKLLNLWVAGGFLDLIPSQPAEKVAGEYLEDLISRCLVLVGRRNFDGKIKTCYMHDLLHQLCLQKAYEEGFKQQHLISNARIASDLSLHLNYHLRSFMLLTPHSDVSPDKLILHLASCTRLRVLDMYFLPLDSFPTKIFHLVNLRYLALNMTYMVDAGISQFLWKLECLVVYGPWIPKVDRSGYLPTLYLDCWKMPWLRNVSVRLPSFFKHSTLPQRLPDGSAIMSDLQTLSTITFSSCTAEVLSLMPRLKKLGVFITKHNLENEAFRRCFENLQSMTELGILKCSFFEGSSQGSEIPSKNLVLDLLPLNLKKLTLCGSCLSWDKSGLLVSLTQLETLKLKDYAFRGQEWELNEVVFGGLKQLLIDETDLVSWEDGGTDNFPCLERLELRSCRTLLKIPFHAFSALERIGLYNCSQSAQDSAEEFREQFDNLIVVSTNKRTASESGGQSIEFGKEFDVQRSFK